ncbi:MAG TPA: TRAP transporter large permease [Paracoccus sp. (in: a-proteobacteria)]|uniref:TRAP transporter large permease n=1 Tax=uncultured Paracoccus sp. TaxID=189685 RepID=UPI002601679D|nr:TRAP transporter large permease [uncultured Paracoccus sp.]HMQ41646.1 TRAP transporter large permease [Paracoccus sp. (in: a-proteobacteria)]HMR34682.1 TRAP transporter large permease [Paracoccus sp. (in: a-proteobacteria)]
MNAAIAACLIILFGLSVPVAVAIGLSAMFGISFFSSMPLLVVPQKIFTSLDSFPLLAVPFFILAGNLMSRGGVSARLVDFAKSLIGGMQGGLASTCVVTCMIFAAISGSSVATTYAIGAILIPAMVAHGYPTPMAATIQASSAELGVIIPPSVPMIIYAVSTETSVTKLFMAGIGPGILIAALLVGMVQIWCRMRGHGKQDGDARLSILTSTYRAFWALMLPVIILGGIYGGVFTPTEAAAVAVGYALLVGMFVYREIRPADLPGIFRTAAVSTAAIMLIIGTAGLLSFLVNLSGLPRIIGTWAEGNFTSQWQFLLAINLLLFAVGMFIETSAAILVLGPVLAPIAIGYGIDPVHFGVVMIVNLAMGMITPPLGVNLFAAASVAQIPVQRMFRSLLMPLATVVLALLLITYIPAISLYLTRGL